MSETTVHRFGAGKAAEFIGTSLEMVRRMGREGRLEREAHPTKKREWIYLVPESMRDTEGRQSAEELEGAPLSTEELLGLDLNKVVALSVEREIRARTAERYAQRLERFLERSGIRLIEPAV